ncbi:Acetylornithine deacetylase [Sedimentisphaera cyanobacteriorum]|uniref:Probable succinyl-diaminopimelate desuccinylase n=1 Tax=Sedimentisphaera cyanobacteriorum TaxID=1940790 RepID=A0A1Q2HNC5_9BACT|nr:M20 family metallopeptidase [Sedimentisphaera cyanobacteriorum]AQQ08860.1 Acetylornithine deacetylase [Sedimentisphaera cyanobacteriorum]
MKELLKNLIEANSTADKGETESAEVLADFFGKRNIDCEIDKWDGSRTNITARIKGKKSGGGILIAGHLDVVPALKSSWHSPPFTLREENGKLFGRGAADMKGPLAASAAAIAEIAENKIAKRDIIFTATAGEETNSCGILRFAEKEKQLKGRLRGIFVPEPTDMKLVTAHKGLLWLKITTSGKTAHGSIPHEGENAVVKMAEAVGRLSGIKFAEQTHPLLGGSTISINKINGGSAANVVPDECRIWADIRLLPGQSRDSAMEEISRLLEGISFKTETERYVDAFETDSDDDFVKDLEQLAQCKPQPIFFTTDAPYLKQLSESIAVIGPGRPDMCHKPDESITEEELNKGREFYKKALDYFAFED